MNWEQVCQLGLELPQVVEDIWFRTPALKVRKKCFVRLKEDGESIVLLLESVDEQEMLIQTRPEIYFITDHYRGYPAVLARLEPIDVDECRYRLEQAWRIKAPKTLVRAFEAESAS